VRFVSDQVNVTRDAEGNILDGDPEQLSEIVDLWTFARDTSTRDPNWELVSTGVGE
jgi:predicted lipid-binding transport protein (Tim44 family)